MVKKNYEVSSQETKLCGKKGLKDSISSVTPFSCLPGIPQQLLKAYKEWAFAI